MHRSYLYPHNPFTLRLAEGYFFICTKKADMTMPLSRDCSWKRDIVACFVLLFAAAGTVLFVRIAAQIRHAALAVLHKELELILK